MVRLSRCRKERATALSFGCGNENQGAEGTGDMRTKLSPEERHRRKILVAIRTEESKRLSRVPKAEKQWRHPYGRKKFRFDTFNIGEVMSAPSDPINRFYVKAD